MNYWKWAVVLLVMVSLGVLVAAPLLGWQPIVPHPPSFGDWRNAPIRPAFSFLDRNETFLSSISILFTLYIVGILILFAVPRRVRCVAGSLSGAFMRLLRLILLGFLIAVLTLGVIISSALSMGTFLLTILLIIILFMGGLLGLISLAFALGRGLVRRAGWQHISPLYSLLLGLLILFALGHIPWIGSILFVVFISLGLGATIISHFGSGDPWNLTPLLEEE